MHWKITALWGGKKVELRETPRAVTPFGGLVVFFEFLRQVGYGQAVRQHLPFRLTSPNAIDPVETFTAFLLAVLAEADFVLHGWLRSGNCGTSRGVVEFLKEALALLPEKHALRVVRADAGFFDQQLLGFLEQRGLAYIVVARLTLWLKREAARITTWRALDEHYAVGEFSWQLFGWDRRRRFVVIREQLRAERASLGRKLLDVPGYTFRVFVTNFALPPEQIWRDYNGRADMENRIAELKHDLAADDFCLREFFATEAAFRSILLLFNLLGEFQRACRFASYRQPATLRAQVFLCGALLGRAGRRLVLHLSVSWGGLKQRIPLLEHLLAYPVSTSPKLHPETAT